MRPNPPKTWGIALLALLCLEGCALDYRELVPFPCPLDQVCPAGLTCIPEVGCTTASPACTSLDPIGELHTCGAMNFSVGCANGASCPADSYCSGSNQCTCNPGFKAMTCDGTSCSGSCAYPNWWCIPQSVEAACAASSSWQPKVQHCADGRATPSGCATQASCEQWCQKRDTTCDTVTQNCPSGAAPRCTLLLDAASHPTTGCVAVLGQAATGAACQFLGTGSDGLDDCAPGNICTAFAAATAERVCRKFCRRDAQCAVGSHCLPLSELTPADGVCVPGCQLFSTCPSETSCTPMLSLELEVVGYCRAIGTAAAAAACQNDTDCAADLSCESTMCTALCDSLHACSSGSCLPFSSTTLMADAGECLGN